VCDDDSDRETVKALLGIAALVVVLTGSGVVATTPAATTPRFQAVEAIDSQFDQTPVYIHFDTDDWR
jgi:hypothetical protein